MMICVCAYVSWSLSRWGVSSGVDVTTEPLWRPAVQSVQRYPSDCGVLHLAWGGNQSRWSWWNTTKNGRHKSQPRGGGSCGFQCICHACHHYEQASIWLQDLSSPVVWQTVFCPKVQLTIGMNSLVTKKDITMNTNADYMNLKPSNSNLCYWHKFWAIQPILIKNDSHTDYVRNELRRPQNDCFRFPSERLTLSIYCVMQATFGLHKTPTIDGKRPRTFIDTIDSPHLEATAPQKVYASTSQSLPNTLFPNTRTRSKCDRKTTPRSNCA